VHYHRRANFSPLERSTVLTNCNFIVTSGGIISPCLWRQNSFRYCLEIVKIKDLIKGRTSGQHILTFAVFLSDPFYNLDNGPRIDCTNAEEVL
jgi:hypothetical protein